MTARIFLAYVSLALLTVAAAGAFSASFLSQEQEVGLADLGFACFVAASLWR